MAQLIRDIFYNSVEKYADLPAVEWLVKKQIHSITYKELGENVTQIRRAYAAHDFSGKHLAIIGGTSLFWVEAYLAMVTGTEVAVPLDVNLPDEDLVELIQRADAEALFIDPKRVSLVTKVTALCPKIREVCFLQDTPVDDAVKEAVNASDSDERALIYSLADLIEEGKTIPASEKSDPLPKPDDVTTIIYTSGTTGKSKGVMLTQNNLAQNVLSVTIDSIVGSVVLSVLPIHHAFCLVSDWLQGFKNGATVAINDSLLHMVRNMAIFKPDIMLMVPMMIETVYKRLEAVDPSVPKEAVAAQVFGGNLHYIFTGGAHLDPFYIDKFADYGIEVLEGYGMSECSPVISMNGMHEHKKGSIGKPLPNVEISFEDGEILVRGTSVMKGYYQMPRETAEALRGGWLHTGDKGYMDEDGYLFINGRVKNLIILSNGENISPEEIESKLALAPFIGEIVIAGENNALAAYVYPDQTAVAKAALTEDPQKVQQEIQAVINDYNRSQPTYKRIVSLTVRKTPFIKSSTQKIRRELVAQEQEA